MAFRAGTPLWISAMRPGRKHDTTALREHDEILPRPSLDVSETGGASMILASTNALPER
jgi:hypothetical protein